MASLEDVVTRCLEGITNVSKEKVIRHVLSCVTEKLVKSVGKAKRIVVDNGIRYHYMIYLETYDKSTYNDLIDMLSKAIDRIVDSLPEDLKKVFTRPAVVDWGEEKYLLFSKEYVAVKYVLE
ncbi:MAG: hypothetical protein GXO23_05755 [Crenarchaeota archaeon]|nr:hypothetical protein [Thermoproteota archaeon]